MKARTKMLSLTATRLDTTPYGLLSRGVRNQTCSYLLAESGALDAMRGKAQPGLELQSTEGYLLAALRLHAGHRSGIVPFSVIEDATLAICAGSRQASTSKDFRSRSRVHVYESSTPRQGCLFFSLYLRREEIAASSISSLFSDL
jgi:hypothetical protein